MSKWENQLITVNIFYCPKMEDRHILIIFLAAITEVGLETLGIYLLSFTHNLTVFYYILKSVLETILGSWQLAVIQINKSIYTLFEFKITHLVNSTGTAGILLRGLSAGGSRKGGSEAKPKAQTETLPSPSRCGMAHRLATVVSSRPLGVSSCWWRLHFPLVGGAGRDRLITNSQWYKVYVWPRDTRSMSDPWYEVYVWSMIRGLCLTHDTRSMSDPMIHGPCLTHDTRSLSDPWYKIHVWPHDIRSCLTPWYMVHLWPQETRSMLDPRIQVPCLTP